MLLLCYCQAGGLHPLRGDVHPMREAGKTAQGLVMKIAGKHKKSLILGTGMFAITGPDTVV
jgi:hypothetical protein